MTEPRTPDDPLEGSAITASAADVPPTAAEPPPERAPEPASSTAPDEADSPTQAWPSLAGPSEAAEPAASAPALATGSPVEPPTGSPVEAPIAPVAPFAPGSTASSPFEPAPSLSATRVGAVGETGTFGAAGGTGGGRSRLRWGLALVGVLVVALGSFLVVSLVGGRPATSTAMGYMPSTTFTYSEARFDLPGDQRQKLGSFLQAFPGFSDQSAIEPKLNELLDRIVKAATQDKQTWTNDIKPWFGGQVAVGAGVPDAASTTTVGMSGANNSLVVLTITDRAKAIAWLTSTAQQVPLDRSTYGDADLFTPGRSTAFAVAVNDKVMLAGSTIAVKAAIDTGGKGTLDQNDDVKAALATLDKDYVVFGVVRLRAYADATLKLIETAQPGALDKTRIDETVLDMVPAWQASTARFENDAIVGSSVGPSWSIGYDSANRPSDVLGHVPAKSILYAEIHDVGPALTAIIGKFRALDEAKPFFSQLDQALSLLGGSDAVYGWWGDTALVVAPLADGTIGGGLVIHPRDAAVADRLLTTLGGFLALGGANSGIATRTEDHNGTKITILDVSGVPGLSTSGLPAGYKAELAWATNADVTVLGYGSSFVAAVLDSGAGNSLRDDARFKALLDRVGADNVGVTFVDLAAIRGLLEPLVQGEIPADKWTYYTTEIQPYLKPLDALIGSNRKDGGLDRGTGVFTAH